MSSELERQVFTCIDNTTLNATDTCQHVADFCRRTRSMRLPSGESVAGVCVYPRFVATAREALEGSGIKVVSVAGAFPHGQAALEVKVHEVEQVVAEGADEVDIVLNRGLLLSGSANEAGREVEAMRRACPGRVLKVILEVCDLPSAEWVALAARVAIEAGADFIKTSTGKGTGGATVEAAEIMLNCIKNWHLKTQKWVGFKAAGGIREVADAVKYAQMAREIVGDDYVKNHTFRIGASSLTDGLFLFLT